MNGKHQAEIRSCEVSQETEAGEIRALEALIDAWLRVYRYEPVFAWQVAGDIASKPHDDAVCQLRDAVVAVAYDEQREGIEAARLLKFISRHFHHAHNGHRFRFSEAGLFVRVESTSAKE